MFTGNGNTVYGVLKSHSVSKLTSSTAAVSAPVKDSAAIAKQTAAVKKALAALKGRSVAALRHKNGSASSATIESSPSTPSTSSSTSTTIPASSSKFGLPSSPATSRCSRPTSPGSWGSRPTSPVTGRFSRPASPVSSRCSPMTGRRDALAVLKTSGLVSEMPTRKDTFGGMVRSSTVPVLTSPVPASSHGSHALVLDGSLSARTSPAPSLTSLTPVRSSPMAGLTAVRSSSTQLTTLKQEHLTSGAARLTDSKQPLDRTIEVKPRTNHFIVTNSGRLSVVVAPTEVKIEPEERHLLGLEAVQQFELGPGINEQTVDRLKVERMDDGVINVNFDESLSLPLLELEDDFLRYWDMPPLDVLSLSRDSKLDSLTPSYDGFSRSSNVTTEPSYTISGIRPSSSHNHVAPLRPPDTIPPPRTHHILLRPPDTIPAPRTNLVAPPTVSQAPLRPNRVVPLRPTNSVPTRVYHPLASLRSPQEVHAESTRPPSLAVRRDFAAGSIVCDTTDTYGGNICDNFDATGGLLNTSSNDVTGAAKVTGQMNHVITSVKSSGAAHGLVRSPLISGGGNLVSRVNSNALAFTSSSSTECLPLLRTPVVVMSSLLSRQTVTTATLSSSGSSVRSLLTTCPPVAFSISGLTTGASLLPMHSSLSHSVLSSPPARLAGTVISRGKTGPSQNAVTIHIPDAPSRSSMPPTIVVQNVVGPTTPFGLSITTQVISASPAPAKTKKRKPSMKQFLACKGNISWVNVWCGRGGVSIIT